MKSNIHYRLAISNDRPAIVNFLREHFFPYETLTYSIEPKKQDAEVEDFLASCVDSANRLCLLAFHGNQIVGVRSLYPKGPDEEVKLLKIVSERPANASHYSKILTIFAKLERDSNVFRKYEGFSVAMHGNGLAVHKDFRGNGIGLKLYEKSMQIAKALGYSLLTCHCSSIYSARLCEIMGMECINVCNMKEYRSPDTNEQVIFPPENQKYIKSYAKVIQ